MAQGLADLGHEVTLLTINPMCTFGGTKTIVSDNLRIKVLPDFFSKRIKSSGFAIWSTLWGVFYAVSHRYDVCIADCGHRFTSIPCKINRLVYKSLYISEWWDFFGKGGYYGAKSRLFKLLWGKIECKREILDKKKADAVIVLSSFMRDRAAQNGIDLSKVHIVSGGSIVRDVPPFYPLRKTDGVIKIAFIGINDFEIQSILPFINVLRKTQMKYKFRLILYGKSISADYCERYDLAEISEFRGWLDYRKNLLTLEDVDIFLQLRKDDNASKAGWPNKIGDYLAFGKPILLSPYGDLEDFVKGKNGFFLVEYNEQSIYDILLKIAELPFDVLRRMGEENRKLAEEISWKSKAEILENIALSLMKERHG